MSLPPIQENNDPEEQGKRCPNCGAMNEAQAPFCSQCGKAMTARVPPTTLMLLIFFFIGIPALLSGACGVVAGIAGGVEMLYPTRHDEYAFAELGFGLFFALIGLPVFALLCYLTFFRKANPAKEDGEARHE